MKIFKSELPIFFDVDDTILIWEGNAYKPGKGKVKVIDPTDDRPRYLKPHKRHVEFLKKCAKRGYQVTVWSAGGWAWAEAAVKALQLEQYVTKVETKPLKYVDDLEAHQILGSRVYLKDGDGSH